MALPLGQGSALLSAASRIPAATVVYMVTFFSACPCVVPSPPSRQPSWSSDETGFRRPRPPSSVEEAGGQVEVRRAARGVSVCSESGTVYTVYRVHRAYIQSHLHHLHRPKLAVHIQLGRSGPSLETSPLQCDATPRHDVASETSLVGRELRMGWLSQWFPVRID